MINDEFAALPISRQQKYQLRRRKEGNCVRCGKPSGGKSLCENHPLRRAAEIPHYECYKTVRSALVSGSLKRGKCWCGKWGESHHKDYSKPLDITWLCHRHHVEIHGKTARKDREIKNVDMVNYHRIYRKTYKKVDSRKPA